MLIYTSKVLFLVCGVVAQTIRYFNCLVSRTIWPVAISGTIVISGLWGSPSFFQLLKSADEVLRTSQLDYMTQRLRIIWLIFQLTYFLPGATALYTQRLSKTTGTHIRLRNRMLVWNGRFVTDTITLNKNKHFKFIHFHTQQNKTCRKRKLVLNCGHCLHKKEKI